MSDFLKKHVISQGYLPFYIRHDGNFPHYLVFFLLNSRVLYPRDKVFRVSLRFYQLIKPLTASIMSFSSMCIDPPFPLLYPVFLWPKILFGCNDTAHSLKKDYNRNYYFKRVKGVWTVNTLSLGILT